MSLRNLDSRWLIGGFVALCSLSALGGALVAQLGNLPDGTMSISLFSGQSGGSVDTMTIELDSAGTVEQSMVVFIYPLGMYFTESLPDGCIRWPMGTVNMFACANPNIPSTLVFKIDVNAVCGLQTIYGTFYVYNGDNNWSSNTGLAYLVGACQPSDPNDPNDPQDPNTPGDPNEPNEPNPDPTRAGLHVTEQVTPTPYVLEESDEDITLYEAHFQANDIVFAETRVLLKATKGVLDDATNYRAVWEDTENGTITETSIEPTQLENGMWVLTSPIQFLYVDYVYTLKIVADAAEEFQGEELQIGLATEVYEYVRTAWDVLGVRPIETDGNCPYEECFIFVDTVATPIWPLGSGNPNTPTTSSRSSASSRSTIGGGGSQGSTPGGDTGLFVRELNQPNGAVAYPGQNNVSLLALELEAVGESFSNVVIRADTFAGSFDDVADIDVLVDINNDGTYEYEYEGQFEFEPEGDLLNIQGFPVQDGQTVGVLVRGTMADQFSGPTLDISLATDYNFYIKAITPQASYFPFMPDGSCPEPECRAYVDLASNTAISLGQAGGNGVGELFVTQDSTIRHRQLFAVQDNGENAVAMKLFLRAEDEAVDVRFLRLFFQNDQEEWNGVSHVLAYRGGEQVGDTRDYQVSDASCSTDGSLEYRCMNIAEGALRVPVGQTVPLELRLFPRFNSIQGNNPENVRIIIESPDDVKAYGVTSGKPLAINDNDNVREGEVFIGRDSAGAHTELRSIAHDFVFQKPWYILSRSAPTAAMPSEGFADIADFMFRNSLTGGPYNSTLVPEAVRFTVQADNVRLDASQITVSSETSNFSAICETYKNGIRVTEGQTGLLTVLCRSLGERLDIHIPSFNGRNIALNALILDNQITPSQPSFLQVRISDFQDFAKKDIPFGLDSNGVHWIDDVSGIYSDRTKVVRWLDYNPYQGITNHSPDLQTLLGPEMRLPAQ